MLEAILEASRHLLVPELSRSKGGLLARQVAGSLLQVGLDVSVCNISNKKTCLTSYPNTKKRIENTTCSGIFCNF